MIYARHNWQVSKMSREPRKDPNYLEGLEKAKKKKAILKSFNKAIEEAVDALASDLALESDASPAYALCGGGSSVEETHQSPGLCATMLPDTNRRRETGVHRRAVKSNTSSSVDADDPFTVALKLRQAALGLTQIPEHEEKHGLTPAWVVTVAVKVFGLEIVGGKPEWLRGPPNGERPAPLGSGYAEEDHPPSGSSPLASTLDAAPDASVTRTSIEDPAGASFSDHAMGRDTSGKAFLCLDQPPPEILEQAKNTQDFEKPAVGTETTWSSTENGSYDEACCAAVNPEGNLSCILCIPSDYAIFVKT